MIRELRGTKMKGGKRAGIVAVDSPEADWEGRITTLLAHKGAFWTGQVKQAYTGRCDALETTCYIALVDDEPVSNIMISKYKGAGLLGHVFTKPEWRRQGLASALMKAALKDFTARGGLALWLGTGYDSPAYHIYSGFKFRSVFPGSGLMVREARKGVLVKALGTPRDDVKIVPLQWQHWAGLTGLLADPDGDYLRSCLLDCYGPSIAEGPFIGMQAKRAEADAFSGVVAECSDGMVAGFAICAPIPWWGGGGHSLDIYVHPKQSRCLKPLIDNVLLPHGKTQVFLDSGASDRIAFCKTQGFRMEAALRNQLRADENVYYDLIILARENGD